MHKALMLLALLHALALVAIGARLWLCIEAARLEAVARSRGHVCEGHGRGNYPYWSDDGEHWFKPPNMRQIERM